MGTVTAIDGVRVFTGEGLTEPRRVYLKGTEISVEETPDVVVDGAGQVLLPGLIDSHVHTVLGRPDLQNLATWGVTTGMDMAAWPDSFVAEMRRQPGVAQIFSATTPAVGPGGNHAKMPGFPAEGIVTTPREAHAFVERRVADGADYIKIVTEAAPPEGMDQATVNAIVAAAHEHDLLVVAHSITTGAFHVAVEAGVDISTHAPLDAVLDDETVRRMRDFGMVCSPTLTMMRGVADLRGAAGLKYEYARDTVTKFHEAGIRLLVGTDANSAPGAPFGPEHGESMHDELGLMVEAGLTPVEVLRGATTLTARTFGLDDRGVIEPGKRADLLLIDGDPTQDISATRAITGVWIAGERIR
ncbi:amidohydrolase family protein [Amycolatopsis sp. WQ 127309]|uniref:amidohydrolase family protein n=1 Tax=Amycolatopsis sp. WQ 127309 TaxID=2932773 RepID=UPI001FF6212A|nr:amidohydrolase family protein [Amycolatopsis sp. WQ 127309]UOZ04879.1 amidohydrolase family protein [Amycolatopsis sp. WQ 127309]